MSDGAAMVLVIITLVAGAWFLFFVFSKALDGAAHITKGVSEKAKAVAATAGQAMSNAALRVQTQKLVKMGLEVSDQQTGLNELNLNADLSKKNDELARRIVDRVFENVGDAFAGGEFPLASALASYALLDVAVQLQSDKQMREKTRIAGTALSMLMKKELAESAPSPLQVRNSQFAMAHERDRISSRPLGCTFGWGGYRGGRRMTLVLARPCRRVSGKIF